MKFAFEEEEEEEEEEGLSIPAAGETIEVAGDDDIFGYNGAIGEKREKYCAKWVALGRSRVTDRKEG